MFLINRQTYPYFEEINEGILKLFPAVKTNPPPRVLDVGCGWGTLAEALKARGYECWGIETHPQAVAKASQRLDRVIAADLTQLRDIVQQLTPEAFDYLVFSDVLEHLYDPFTIFEQYLFFLKPKGKVFLSVPNIAVWEVRLKLLFGSFNYRDTGVLDRTHIRFFTFRTARKLVEAAKCRLIQVDHTPYLTRAFLPLIKGFFRKSVPSPDGAEPSRAIFDSSYYRFYMKFIYPVEYLLAGLWKSMFAFRIIIAAQKNGAKGVTGG
jgi:2-polyprenyl-3-methyl-5-hydroxy-6-metoxy-1,4-benzoquinol methylase